MSQIFSKAVRVWDTPTDDANQYRLFLNRFRTQNLPASPVLRIRADNRYSVTVNGTWIAAQQYSDYDFYPTYDEIPLSPALFRVGENEITVLGYCQNEDSSTYRKGEPSLIFELLDGTEPLAWSGADTLVSADTGFVSGGGVELLSGQLSYSFRYDANNAEHPAFRPATVLPAREMTYHARPIPQLTVGEPLPAKIVACGEFKPYPGKTSGVRINRDYLSARFVRFAASGDRLPSAEGIRFAATEGDGVYFVADFGKESVGYLTLDFDVPADCTVVGGIGEHLSDLRVRADVGGRNFAFFIYAKAGRNRVFWPIKRIGGRYLEFHIGAPSATVRAANLRPVSYPVVADRMPEGMNVFERRVYEIAVRTLESCMHEHYEDCPWREQALYAMDSRNQMLFGYDAFGETALPKASLRLLALGQQESGLLELCAPSKLALKVTIPSFTLVWITELEEYYRVTGDREFLAEMKPYLDRVLNYFETNSEGGLTKTPAGLWNFYEWAPNLDGRGTEEEKAAREAEFEAPLNAFYAMALRAAEKICRALGEKEQEKHLRALREKLAVGYRAAFYDGERRAFRLTTGKALYKEFPELVQALSLCADLVPEEISHELAARMAQEEFTPRITLSHRIYYYQALLCEKGMEETVLRDVEKHWGPMTFAGATTFWETEEGDPAFHDAGSLCHGWSAAPIYVYHRIYGKEG